MRTEDSDFIADVGFGGQSPSAPLRLEPGLEQATSHGAYRVGRDGDTYELQLRVGDRWEAMYRFSLAPQAGIDFEVANWFTSTHPRSRFTQNLIVCRVLGEKRFNLFKANLAIRHADGSVEHAPWPTPANSKYSSPRSWALNCPSQPSRSGPACQRTLPSRWR